MRIYCCYVPTATQLSDSAKFFFILSLSSVLLFTVFLTAPSISSHKTTSGGISFQCHQPHSSTLYYGKVSDADAMKPLPPFSCEIDSCHCTATGLKPNTGYIVALKACIRTVPNVCSSDSQTKKLYTKPERKFSCSLFNNLATVHVEAPLTPNGPSVIWKTVTDNTGIKLQSLQIEDLNHRQMVIFTVNWTCIRPRNSISHYQASIKSLVKDSPISTKKVTTKMPCVTTFE